MSTPSSRALDIAGQANTLERKAIADWNSALAARILPGEDVLIPAEVEKRQAARREKAKSNILSYLRGIGSVLQRELDQTRALIDKTYWPLSFSNLTTEREAGAIAENRAFRTVSVIPLEQLPGEYEAAMTRGQIEIASWLLDWSRKTFDLSDAKQRKVIEDLEAKHIETLQLGTPLADRDLLKKKLDEIAHRIELVESGNGNAFTWLQLNQMSQAEMLAAGLDLVNSSVALHQPPAGGR